MIKIYLTQIEMLQTRMSTTEVEWPNTTVPAITPANQGNGNACAQPHYSNHPSTPLHSPPSDATLAAALPLVPPRFPPTRADMGRAMAR